MRVGRVAFAGVIMLLVLACAAQAKAPTPARLQLGAAGSGGTYYIWGAGWAQLMNSCVPGVDIAVEVTGGPVGNLQLLQNREVDLGMTTGFIASQAYNGVEWAKGKKHDRIRAIFPMYSSLLHMYSLQSKGIVGIGDFNGKHISTGTAGSTSDTAGRAVLEVLGITPRRISSLVLNTAADGLRDGTIDAGFAVSAAPAPFMMDLETTHRIKHISLTLEQQAAILAQLPYSEGVIAKGTYRYADTDINTIAFWNFMVADKDLPDGLVYELVKATFENQKKLEAIDPSAKEVQHKNILYSPIPLHPGALKYYREVGLAIPDRLVP